MSGKKASWNAGNPSVKRILREAAELRQNPCREFVAYPTEESVFEWVFTLRGPADTEYAEGFYRGRIILQANYPFAPPDIMLLTPNGRFELNKKICLSISSYHPENWHPTWGVKTVLHALREFMATPGNNGIGAIEYSKEQRRQLARESLTFVCPITKASISEDIELMNASPPSVSGTPELPAPVEGTAPEETTSPSTPATVESTKATDSPPAVATPEKAAASTLSTASSPGERSSTASAAPAAEPAPAAAAAVTTRPQIRVVTAEGEGSPVAVVVVSEGAVNAGIVMVLMAILAILAKKALAGDLFSAYLAG
eukprot:RCo020930